MQELKRAAEKWTLENPKAAGKRSAGPSGGVVGLVGGFVARVRRILMRCVGIVAAILYPIAWVISHALPFAGPCARKLYQLTMTRPGPDGTRHFAPRRAICTVAIVAGFAVTARFWGAAAYYYGTARWLDNVYVPDAAVFVNQQFAEANQPGKQIAPRDEIFTIMGRWPHDGVVEPVRFDIDYNAFFLTTTARPDLLAARLNSQSPYGVRADVEVTGIYVMLPRYFRSKYLKWFNLRSEIVDVRNVEDLSSMPPFVTVDNEGSPAKANTPAARVRASGTSH
jgi:hypothetical protein